MIYIHQPNFMPWLGMLDAMFKSSTFVVLDNVQFEIGGWQNRNLILSPNGKLFITVPVVKKSFVTICDVRISSELSKLCKAIHFNYKRAPHFNLAEPILQILEKHHEYLLDLNMEILYAIKSIFKMDINFLLASTLNLKSSSKKDRIFEIIRVLNEKEVYCGNGARNYLATNDFLDNGFNVIWQPLDFHPQYLQRFYKNGFVSNLSFIDMLLNVGVDGIKEKMNIA